MKYIAALLLIIFITVISSCGNKPATDTKGAAIDVQEKEHAHENSVSLTRDQLKAIGVELGLIEKKELTNAIKANGMLMVPNQNKAFVTPLSSGVIRSLK